MNKKIIYIGTLLTTLNAALAASAANPLVFIGGVPVPIPTKTAPADTAQNAEADKKDAPADTAQKAEADKKDAPADTAQKAEADKKDAPADTAQKANEKAPKMNSLPPINWQPQPKLALTDENKNSAKKTDWPFASKVTAHENDLASQRDYPFEKPLDTRDEKVDDDRKNAVKDGVKDILEPAEIGTVQKKKLDAQGAIAFPGYAGERLPAAKRKDINFSANNIAPTNITLAQNVPSAVVFLDKKGTPWPIESIAYDPRVYSVNGQGCGQDSPAQAINDNRPTNLSITVCNFWTWGTFTVKLENISIPLAFVAESGKKGDDEGFVDVPIVIHITDGVSPSKEKNVVTGKNGSEPVKKSPLKKAGKIEQEPVETAYQSFLTGEAPQQATKVATSDSNTAAWIWQGQLYFLTKYQVLAPNYELVANNADGTVYKFARSTSRIFGTDGYGREHVVMIGN